MNEKRSFIANLNNLAIIIEWVRERIIKYFSQNEMIHIEGILEEIILKIIENNHPNQNGQLEIALNVNDTLEIKIKDFGEKFNPLDKIDIQYKGLFDIDYSRKKTYNILILSRKHNINY